MIISLGNNKYHQVLASLKQEVAMLMLLVNLSKCEQSTWFQISDDRNSLDHNENQYN